MPEPTHYQAAEQMADHGDLTPADRAHIWAALAVADGLSELRKILVGLIEGQAEGQPPSSDANDWCR